MTLSNSRAAYTDCFEILDRALESTHGIKITYPSQGDAHQMLTRLQRARILDRETNAKIYEQEPDNPAYGTSTYDKLIVRMPRKIEGKWVLRIEPRAVNGEIEELKAAE